MKTVTFCIDENDKERFELLEMLAMTEDESLVRWMRSCVKYCNPQKREITSEEMQQRNEWMSADPGENSGSSAVDTKMEIIKTLESIENEKLLRYILSFIVVSLNRYN